MKKSGLSRRKALASFGSLVAASPLVADQPKLIGEPPGRIAPRTELVNVLEFEDVAARKLAATEFSMIAGSDRAFFDRITFRPRLMIPTSNMDLTSELLGEKLFAPILVGPTARQQTFHADGELAMVRGASAAKAVMVVSSESSYPVEKIAAEAKTSLWYQVYPDADTAAVRTRIQQARKAGCKAVVITVGAPVRTPGGPPNPARLAGLTNAALNWKLIDELRHGLNVPVLLKGVMSPEVAGAAVKNGVQGIVVSNYGGLLTPGMAPPLEMLPSVVDAAGKVPVLIDGNFRRGSDILKALAFGAAAVLLGRPVLWGLAAYGAEGVQTVIEMLQSELARDMAQCCRPDLKALDRTLVKIHGRA